MPWKVWSIPKNYPHVLLWLIIKESIYFMAENKKVFLEEPNVLRMSTKNLRLIKMNLAPLTKKLLEIEEDY